MKKKTPGNTRTETVREPLRRAKLRLTHAKESVKLKKQLAQLAKVKFKQAKKEVKRARKVVKRAKAELARVWDEVKHTVVITPKRSVPGTRKGLSMPETMSLAVRPAAQRHPPGEKPATGIPRARRVRKKLGNKFQRKLSARKPARTDQRSPATGLVTGVAIPTRDSGQTSVPAKSDVGSSIPPPTGDAGPPGAESSAGMDALSVRTASATERLLQSSP